MTSTSTFAEEAVAEVLDDAAVPNLTGSIAAPSTFFRTGWTA